MKKRRPWRESYAGCECAPSSPMKLKTPASDSDAGRRVCTSMTTSPQSSDERKATAGPALPSTSAEP